MFSLQRDYQHVSRLKLSLFLLLPAFLAMRVVMRWIDEVSKSNSHRGLIHRILTWVGRSATQNIAQYILAFSLPFFLATQRWIYLGFTFLLFVSTLWDPWWVRLTRRPIYLILLQLWALLCALGYLYPFFWPNHLDHFHHAMLLLSIVCIIPAHLSKTHIKQSAMLALLPLTMLVLLPREGRFPILSVWLNRPHFAFDETILPPLKEMPADLSSDQLKAFIESGHSLCCVAPVIAPADVREKVTQNWSLDGKSIERPQLNTLVSGNPYGKPFHSFYCKRNFPRLANGSVMACDLYLADRIYLGQVAFHVK